MQNDEFIRKRNERNVKRAYRKQQKRRFIKSNLKYARRPVGWREWLQSIIKKRVFLHRFEPIPVHLRPWVPHVAYDLASPDRVSQRTAILSDARSILSDVQFRAVYKEA